MKTAFLFSGQGAQYAGMGEDLYEGFPVCREVYEEASEAVGYRILDLSKDQLSQTEFAQPAILTLSYACYRLLQHEGVSADIMAGFSLGEYTALTAAGVLSFPEVIKLVQLRGQLMQRAVPPETGAMSAVLGTSETQCELACEKAREHGGYVACANYNSSEQIVIAGETEAVALAERIVLEMGAKRVLRLNVSVPSHCAMMNPVAEPLEEAVKAMTMGTFGVPVLSNFTGQPYEGQETLIPRLCAQLVHPVRWDKCSKYLIQENVERCVEMGPGRTLTAFVRHYNRIMKVYNIENTSGLFKFISSNAGGPDE